MESLAETLMTPSTTQNDLAFAGSDWSRKARVAPRNVITAFTGEKVARKLNVTGIPLFATIDHLKLLQYYIIRSLLTVELSIL